MAKTAADVLVESLIQWGVDTIFGIPGDGINGVMESLRTHQEQIRFIQVRHEESAALMACAWAKYTGKLGVCLATSGPGGIHLLNGLYDAKMDGASVLAITGMPFHDLTDTFTQQDVALDRLFMDVAVYSTRVMGPEHVENVAEIACRTAVAYHKVTHISFPTDIQDMKVSRKTASKRNVEGHTSLVHARSGQLPDESDLRRAAEILNTGNKIAILAGQGALHATAALLAVAEKLNAPIVKALLGKAVVPDDSPFTTGGIGLLGTKPSQDALETCDTLLMVGTSFPYIEFLPRTGKARAVQIDLDPIKIGLRYDVEVGLVGDSRRTLEALLPMLTNKQDRSFLDKAQKEMQVWQELLKKRFSNMDKPMKPQVIAHELGKRLRADAIVSCDSGTNTTWWARHIPAQRGQMFSCSGTLATMACGLPYTIAAQIAYPQRQCIAFVGDGGFTMLMGELATAVKYKLPIVIVIIKNDTLGQIKWEQMVFLGNPEFAVELQPIDFVKFAEACGATGIRIDDPKECGALLDRALAAAISGPVVIEAVVDPLEAPMPAKVTFDQATKFAESLLRGEPDRGKIVSTAVADKVRELI
jgi:pyruvate dehydrogenase (quinone)/pyruvate oxidase